MIVVQQQYIESLITWVVKLFNSSLSGDIKGVIAAFANGPETAMTPKVS